MVENPRFAVEISMLYVTFPQIVILFPVLADMLPFSILVVAVVCGTIFELADLDVFDNPIFAVEISTLSVIV